MLDPRCDLLIKFVEAAPERGGGWGELWQYGSESGPEKIRLYSPGDPEVLYNLGIAYFHQYEWKAYKGAVAYRKDATDIAKTDLRKLPSEPLGPWKSRGSVLQDRSRLYSIELLSRSVLAQVYAHMTIRPAYEVDEYAGTVETNYSLALSEANAVLKEADNWRGDTEMSADVQAGARNAMGLAQMSRAQRVQESPELLLRDAVEQFGLALTLNPDDARLLSILGSATLFLAENFKRADRPDWDPALARAESLFERVLELRPDYDFAYCRLARIAMARGDGEPAQSYLELAAEHPSEMTPKYLERLRKHIEELHSRPNQS
jgi:tetratricopeptide (TPR) repeat protein